MNKKLDDHINHRIATIAGLLKRQIFRIIAEKGVEITPDQWVILNYLWEEDGLTIGELAERSRKDFANVTRMVDKLQKQNYVTKRRSDADGRSYIVHYTYHSLALKPKVEACQQESIAISLKGISEEDQQTVLRTLAVLEKNTLEYLE